MSWLDEEELKDRNAKKKLEEYKEKIENDRKRTVDLIATKLQKSFEIANELRLRINELYPFAIYGHGTYAGQTSLELESTKAETTKVFDDSPSHSRYHYKKRRVLLTTHDSETNNVRWRFVEDKYEYESFTTSNWPDFDKRQSYDNKIDEKTILDKQIPISKFEIADERFWLKVFEWLLHRIHSTTQP